MDRLESEFTPSYLFESEYLNSKLGPEDGTWLVVLRALADVRLCFNSTTPVVESPKLPENHLGEIVYRAGLHSFTKAGGPKWR